MSNDLREALEPFAEMADVIGKCCPNIFSDNEVIFGVFEKSQLTLGDFKRAKQALDASPMDASLWSALEESVSTMGDWWKSVECKCDPEVGYICERCAILGAKQCAVRMINALRNTSSPSPTGDLFDASGGG